MGRAVGTGVRRKDGDAKVTGAAKYIDDLTFPGMLFGATVRSTIPRGELVNTHIDLSPDFIVADYRDIPGKNYVALLDPDQPCLAEREVRHVAEPILLVAHADRRALFGIEKHVPGEALAMLQRAACAVHGFLHRLSHERATVG